MPASAALCSSVRLWSPQRNKFRIQPAMRKKKQKQRKKTLLPHCTLTSLMYFLFWFGVMLIMHRAHNTLLHPDIPSSIFSFLLSSCHGLNQVTRFSPSSNLYAIKTTYFFYSFLFQVGFPLLLHLDHKIKSHFKAKLNQMGFDSKNFNPSGNFIWR